MSGTARDFGWTGQENSIPTPRTGPCNPYPRFIMLHALPSSADPLCYYVLSLTLLVFIGFHYRRQSLQFTRSIAHHGSARGPLRGILSLRLVSMSLALCTVSCDDGMPITGPRARQDIYFPHIEFG